MTTAASKDQLLQAVDQAVEALIARCESGAAGASTEGPGWGPKEVLAHFLYYHEIAAWGVASVNTGGPPWRSPATADQMNAAAVPLHAGEPVSDLITQVRLAHARLVKAVQEAPDIDAVVGFRGNGEAMTLAQRLQLTANHWRGHLKELTGS